MRTAPKTAVALFQEYRKDEEAALQPCLHCLFEACPEDELPQLHALLEAWDEDYHSPPYSPVQMRRIQEKMAPIFEAAMSDPAVIAAEDQRAARWRDTPWWRREWRKAKFSALCWKIRLSGFRRPQPWE